jgi:1-acyl-sn-glycerol-3-phosphate acyltransferase
MPDPPERDSSLPDDLGAFDGLSHGPVGRLLAALPRRWFRARLEGAEHLPEGGALLVGNHAMFGLDGVVLGSLVLRETHRHLRFLGERNLFRFGPLARVLHAAGAVEGAPENAVALLRRGEWVAVYPGGIDDSWKTSAERYELKWGTRAGFARVAMRAGVPILPVAALGIDEMYTVVARERWLGRLVMGSPRYDLPVLYGAYGTLVPRRTPQRYVIGAPIDTAGDATRAEDVERVRAATHDGLSAMLRDVRG